MNYSDEDTVPSTSYFWDCIRLSPDCPFVSELDPKFLYFGFGLILIYTALVLTILADLKFYWTLDEFQLQIDHYLNFVKRKVRTVQLDQKRLVSTQERTETVLAKTEQSKRMVIALRGALADEDSRRFSFLARHADDPNIRSAPGELWKDRSAIDF